MEPIRRDDAPDRFLVLLREYNRQREKSFDEKLREEVVSSDPEEAYQSLIDYRRDKAAIDVTAIAMRGVKHRAEISKAKLPFLNAVLDIIQNRKKFWPLSDRQIHYALLNAPPLSHASKPSSRYANTIQCYKALVDLLTRARLEDIIPMDVIADATRPMVTWNVNAGVQAFIHSELNGFLKNYWRDLMRSQPNHIEIVGEKNTIDPIIRPVAEKYCIPMTIGRGYCSLPPRYRMAQRFRCSGKDKLILLAVSDFDPDGEEIAHSFARSMRDDFDIDDIVPIKVALTAQQVKEFNLPPTMKAKKGKKDHYAGIAAAFVNEHGDDVFELEALQPELLQKLLTDAIDSVIDIDTFNAELSQEREDALLLDATRRRIKVAITGEIGSEVAD